MRSVEAVMAAPGSPTTIGPAAAWTFDRALWAQGGAHP